MKENNSFLCPVISGRSGWSSNSPAPGSNLLFATTQIRQSRELLLLAKQRGESVGKPALPGAGNASWEVQILCSPGSHHHEQGGAPSAKPTLLLAMGRELVW